MCGCPLAKSFAKFSVKHGKCVFYSFSLVEYLTLCICAARCAVPCVAGSATATAARVCVGHVTL